MSHLRNMSILFCFSICVTGMIVSAASAATSIEGSWQGALDVGPTELRLVIHISKGDDGTLTATIDSPDQGAKGIKVERVTFQNGTLRLDITVITSVYEGTVNTNMTEIDGTWSQSGQQFPLLVKRVDPGEVESVDRPQEPKPPFPYTSEDVTFQNEDANITLAGTLTIPDDGGPFAVALLISGSGPQDRDEAIMGHKPFLVIADHLTRNGVAVLRYDERGVGESEGKFETATSEDFASDVHAAVSFLKKHPKIDAKQIGLVGHSEGGLVAPMVAAKNNDIIFVVLLAGPGVTGEEILYEQGALLAAAQGASEEDIADQRRVQEKMFAVLKKEPDLGKAKDQIEEVVRAEIDKLTEAEKEALGDIDAYVDGQTRPVATKWFQFFLTYDPVPALSQTRCPVLALIGEKDLQVPPKQNLPAIKRALVAGGNKDVTVRELPGLNHLFQTAETGSVLEYGKIAETFSPTALEIISGWIKERTGVRGTGRQRTQ